jgi:hypothetical protein
MALKRLDEEFELKPGTQLLPYMKRLLPSLEGRFQNLESTQDILAGVNEEIRAAALLRMNEILIPATKDILEVTQLGFLLAPVSGQMTIGMGYMTFTIEEGVQRETFTPSPYLIIEHSPDDYAIARMMSYDQVLGILEVTITAIHGNAGPWNDWVVSSTPGMADSTKLYHDAVGPMHDVVVTDYNEIVVMHAEILQAANDLEAAGLDLYNYIRKDGTTPFEAVQAGVHPVINSNDNMMATTAWTRARMNEYLQGSMSSSGAVMTGPLYLAGAPTQPLMAATKGYVDSIIGAGGTISNVVTINTSNPSLRLRSTATNENRMIEALSVDGIARWTLTLANNDALTGGNTGANFSLTRYSDTGVLIDSPIAINRATGLMSVLAMNVANRPVLTTAGGLTLTGGFNFTAYQQANGSFTLTPLNGNYQFTSNVGAFTITAPTVDCAVDVLITNGAGAAAITFSGFTVGANTGDLLTVTNGHRFIISFRRINSVATYVIKALQ